MLGEGEFKKVTMMGPWMGRAAVVRDRRLMDVDEIQAVGEERIPKLVLELDAETMKLLDPYSLTRLQDYDDEDAEDIDAAVGEWCMEALYELMTAEAHNWVAEGGGIGYQWVTGGVTTSGNYPERAAEIIESLHKLGLFRDVITQAELDRAQDRIAVRAAMRTRKPVSHG